MINGVKMVFHWWFY